MNAFFFQVFILIFFHAYRTGKHFVFAEEGAIRRRAYFFAKELRFLK